MKATPNLLPHSHEAIKERMDRISVTTSRVDGGDYNESLDPAALSPQPGGGESSSLTTHGGYDPASSGRRGPGGGIFNSPNPASSSTPNNTRGESDGSIGVANNNNNNGDDRGPAPMPPYGTRSLRNGNRRDVHVAPRIVGAAPPAGDGGRGPRGSHASDPITPGSNMSLPDRDSLASHASPQQRISELRQILCEPGLTDEAIFAIIRENDRVAEESRLSQHLGGAPTSDSSRSLMTSSSSRSYSGGSGGGGGGSSGGGGNNIGGGRRRRWHPCQVPPTRPGAGGPVDGGRDRQHNVGVLDQVELDMKKINAIHSVKETLNHRLGCELHDSQFEEMDRLYLEEERAITMAGASSQRQRGRPLLPAMMMWDAPPPSRRSQVIKEPDPPVLGGPLPLPRSFGGGGVSELCLGRFVADVAAALPNGVDDNLDERRVEETNDADGRRAWVDVEIDDSPMGPYDRLVRCEGCKAGLRVHMEAGLVACPRCRAIRALSF